MRSKPRKPLWRRALTFLLILGSGYLLVCIGLAKLYVSPIRTAPPSLSNFKRVLIPGGEPIWISPGLQSDKSTASTLYVMVHGLGGGVGHWSAMGTKLIAKHFDVLLVELPAHGDSPDSCCTFGVKESDVIVEATRWARAKYAKPPKVVLVGVSLGGSSAWLATQKAPELFDAIVTEGAFARLSDVTNQWFDRKMPEGHIIFWPVTFFASEFSGIDASKVNPVDAARQWKKPALVIHCDEDNLMKRSYADDLAHASGAEEWIIPKASHAQGCQVAEAEYERRLLAFAATPAESDPGSGNQKGSNPVVADNAGMRARSSRSKR